MSDVKGGGGRGGGRTDEREAGDGWGTAAVWILLGLMILGVVATAHSVWHTLLR